MAPPPNVKDGDHILYSREDILRMIQERRAIAVNVEDPGDVAPVAAGGEADPQIRTEFLDAAEALLEAMRGGGLILGQCAVFEEQYTAVMERFVEDESLLLFFQGSFLDEKYTTFCNLLGDMLHTLDVAVTAKSGLEIARVEGVFWVCDIMSQITDAHPAETEAVGFWEMIRANLSVFTEILMHFGVLSYERFNLAWLLYSDRFKDDLAVFKWTLVLWGQGDIEIQEEEVEGEEEIEEEEGVTAD